MSTQTKQDKPFDVIKAQELERFISDTETHIAESEDLIKLNQDFIAKGRADVDRAQAALVALRGTKPKTPAKTTKKRAAPKRPAKQANKKK